MRLRLLLVAVLCMLAVPVAVLPQSVVKVQGKVTDANNGKPLPGVFVAALKSGYGAVTDANGNFEIRNVPEGEYQFEAACTGYETQSSALFRIESDHVTMINFRMKVKPFNLEGITVLGDRINSEMSDPSSSRRVINEDEIQRSGCNSVGEVLEGLAGIYVQATGPAGSRQTASIRGSKTDEVMVLVDGIRVSKPHGGATDLSLIPLSIIQEITVIKGGNSSQYGADALAGVIYIKTKQTNTEKQRSVTGQTGSFGMKSFQASWSKKWSHWETSWNYDRKSGDGNFSYKDPYGIKRLRDNADFVLDNLFVKLNYLNKKTILTFSGFANGARRGLPGFMYNLTPEARSKDVQNIYNVRLYREFNLHWSVEGQSAYNGYHDENKQNSYPAYHTKNQSYSVDNSLRVKREWRKYFVSSLNVSNRMDKGKLGFVINPLSVPGEKTNQVTAMNVYNEYNRHFSGFIRQLVGIASFGYAKKHQGEGYFTPKMGFVTNIDAPFSPSIRSNWSRSFRLPDFYDLYYEGYRTLGNPNLKPERGRDFDAGVSLSIPFFGMMRMDGTYFYNTRYDMIHWRQRFDGIFYPFNLSKVLMHGNEWELEWKSLQDLLRLGINYTYMEALNKTGDRTTDNKILTNRPIHNANVQGTVNISPFYFTATQRFVGRRYIREANSKWIAPYRVTDVILGGKFILSGIDLNIRAGVYNLWNREYAIVELAPMPGREFRLSGEVAF